MVSIGDLKHEALFPIFVRQGRSREHYKSGYINSEGTIVIKPRFDHALPFSEGLASVQIGEKWGAIAPFCAPLYIKNHRTE